MLYKTVTDLECTLKDVTQTNEGKLSKANLPEKKDRRIVPLPASRWHCAVFGYKVTGSRRQGYMYEQSPGTIWCFCYYYTSQWSHKKSNECVLCYVDQLRPKTWVWGDVNHWILLLCTVWSGKPRMCQSRTLPPVMPTAPRVSDFVRKVQIIKH